MSIWSFDAAEWLAQKLRAKGWRTPKALAPFRTAARATLATAAGIGTGAIAGLLWGTVAGLLWIPAGVIVGACAFGIGAWYGTKQFWGWLD